MVSGLQVYGRYLATISIDGHYRSVGITEVDPANGGHTKRSGRLEEMGCRASGCCDETAGIPEQAGQGG
jgi:hypothetical protein